MDFPARLKQLRLAAGLTQEALAHKCGWSGQSRVGNYEAGRGDPKFAELPLIADALGVPVAALFEDVSIPREMSQPTRTDFAKIGGAALVLHHYLRIVGDPPEWIGDAVMLETAYAVVEESGAPVTQDNVVDLTARLGRKLREAGGQENGQRKVRRAGT